MKQKTLKLLLLLLAVPVLAAAQRAYKGQLHVSEERFALKGELLHVFMKVSYDDHVLNTGETLVFTPVLKTSDRYVRLSSVAINGDARERYEKRSSKLQNRRRINVPVVTRDASSHTRHFIYDTTIPYQQWMSAAALYAECEESSWQGRNARTYEDLLLRRLPFVRPVGSSDAVLPVGSAQGQHRIDVGWIHFLAPVSDDGRTSTLSGTLRLPYGRQLTRRDLNALGDSLQEIIGRETSTYANRLLSVTLTGYGAPIGNRLRSEVRASEQTLQLRRILIDRHVTGEQDLRVTWVAEDWDSIRQIVSTAPMTLRAATEDIISSIGVAQGREHALETLGSGSAYSYLCREVFPQVCRLSYVLSFTPRPANYAAYALQNGSIPEAITPDNFYRLATAFEVGSEDFCDVIDLAARLFPNCPEANIDAAGVALLRGDTQKARRYITPWDTDSRAWCNMGLLYLMEGNRDKAEVYLRMAESDGVRQAKEALKHLRWQ